MSEPVNEGSTPTLEEALTEIASLKSQLSGSDLKVFTQNRELRLENQKLKDEIQRLAEECVTQTFAVKDLENTNAQLQAKVADLESELGIHKSQELHLSQELQRTVESNEQELERLKSEFSQEVEQTRQTLEQAKLELEQKLAEELRRKEGEIQQLQERVEQFKEEFLSQELSPIAALKQTPTSQEGSSALVLLRERMEGFLGFPGRALVEQVFRLSGADETTTDPAKLEETFEALQDTAGKFVKSPQQEEELNQLLSSAWQDLGLGSSEAPASREADAEALLPEAEEKVEDEADQSEPSSEPELDQEEQPRALTLSTEAQVDSPPAEAFSQIPEAFSAATTEIEEAFEDLFPEDSAAPAEPSGEIPLEGSQVPEGVVEEQAATEEPSAQPLEESPEQPPDEILDAEGSDPESDSEDIGEVQVDLPADSSDDQQARPEISQVVPVAPPPTTEEDLAPEAAVESYQSPANLSVEELDEGRSEEGEQDLEAPSTEDETILDTESSESVSVEADTTEAIVPSIEPPPILAVEPEPVAAEAEGSADQQVEPGTPDDEQSFEAEKDSDEESQHPETTADIATAGESPETSLGAELENAKALLEAERFLEALPLFEALSEEDPGDPSYLVGQIVCLTNLERYDDAYQLGRDVDPQTLGESAEVFRESFENTLIAMANQTESELVRKMLLIRLIEISEDEESLLTYLDEAESIPLRTPREGTLSLFQARYRVGSEDVTEHLLEALNTVSDNDEIFGLLKTNLERYPELAPLSEFMDHILDSPRDRGIEAEEEIQEFLPQEENLQDLLMEIDPSEETLIQVFLEHLLPRTGVNLDIPCEDFEELLQDSEPAAFVGSLRQALRSIDYTLFFDELDVLAYDGDDHFVLRSSPEPKPTLLFGSEVDDVPPEELRFLVLRELFAMYRRHSHLLHLSSELDDSVRLLLVNACIDIHKEADIKLPDTLMTRVHNLQEGAVAGGQDPGVRRELERLVQDIYKHTESDSFLELADFLYDNQLTRKWLDPIADSFAARQTGLAVASYAIARDHLTTEEYETLEETGFGWLYNDENLPKYKELRLRLQRLWTLPFKLLSAEAEE